ncbi:MAG: penicillin acylase family protein, partial [Calditrichota bacterium]
FVSDGRDPIYDWQGWIERAHLPGLVNPGEGYVASSNQRPVNESYPYHLYGKFSSFERSVRIAEVLQNGSNIKPQDMMQLQLDATNVLAREVLPTMMQLLPWEDLSLSESDQIDLLNNWDFQQVANSEAATFFAFWWLNIERITWKDEFSSDEGELLYPKDHMLMQLILEEPNSEFFDVDSSEIIENCSDVLLMAFQQTRLQLYSDYDALDGGWQWGKIRGTDIRHMARIAGLGRTGLETGGSSKTVNATKRVHGPTWRMVVEMSDPVKAWGVYPGGQSGNPGSVGYDSAVDDWLAGKFYELKFIQSPDELDRRTVLKPVAAVGSR